MVAKRAAESLTGPMAGKWIRVTAVEGRGTHFDIFCPEKAEPIGDDQCDEPSEMLLPVSRAMASVGEVFEVGGCAALNEFLMDAFYCLSVSGSACPQSVPPLPPLLRWAGVCVGQRWRVGEVEGEPALTHGGGGEIPGGFQMDVSVLRLLNTSFQQTGTPVPPNLGSPPPPRWTRLPAAPDDKHSAAGDQTALGHPSNYQALQVENSDIFNCSSVSASG